jgi:phage shock protein A
MNEKISQRIRRIVTGSANSIVTKIEGLAPEMILEQAINEVDGALDEVKVELGRTTAQRHHVSKAMSKLNAEHSSLAESLKIAGNDGRRDLQEAGVSRQLDIEDQLSLLESQLADLGHEETELNRAIAGLVGKRNEMEEDLEDFKVATKEAARIADQAGGNEGGGGVSPQIKADRAERAFDRVLRNSTGVGRVRIKGASAESEKLVELADLNKKSRIEARLKAMDQG